MFLRITYSVKIRAVRSGGFPNLCFFKGAEYVDFRISPRERYLKHCEGRCGSTFFVRLPLSEDTQIYRLTRLSTTTDTDRTGPVIQIRCRFGSRLRPMLRRAKLTRPTSIKRRVAGGLPAGRDPDAEKARFNVGGSCRVRYSSA